MACSTDAEDDAWIEARITKTKALIVAYEDAILAIASGEQSYSLDTGQTRQTVTRANVASMQSILEQLENRLSTLQLRLCGKGVTHVIPGF